MNVTLAQNNYGKSRVRLLRVTRREQQHEVRDLTFSIQFEGDFEAAHTAGDNRKILPTDTMKNTLYVLAKQFPVEPVEDFSMHLIAHFLTDNAQVSQGTRSRGGEILESDPDRRGPVASFRLRQRRG